ncbi:hypothetical protein K443DRAFT_684551 [Laccaria amethystina LaAM-08-1]|uniref:SAP domain-containing protein n=1 Tax=Laccaria amethystina LaAM-08-1 TaxID=1095629 RepID=A0A0C9XB38_9AGAR|nr:hypothetical protein K443DRAFT_684551 [Laccaria amethystina LaAM-08-1]
MNQEQLPFPGSLGPDGTREIRYLTLNGQPKSDLKEWCREFKLDISGNVADLTARLREYSGDDERWKSLGLVKTHSHKGPDSSLPLLHALPTEHSKDHRTAQQIAMVVPWAKSYVKRFPYKPPVQRTDEVDPHSGPLESPGEQPTTSIP